VVGNASTPGADITKRSWSGGVTRERYGTTSRTRSREDVAFGRGVSGGAWVKAEAEAATVPRSLSGIASPLVGPAGLLAIAALGWWWSTVMAKDMSSTMDAHQVLSLGGFIVAWLAMMTAMMFPAIVPVVKLYARAAGAGRVAPMPYFVSGYLAVWGAMSLPAYLAWRALMEPLTEGRAWTGRLAGSVLVAAAVWQLTPFKSVCLRHCRSPMSFFMRFGAAVSRPAGALRLGATHAAYCVGCCWALMAILVAVGTMNLAWMLALSVLILFEKNARSGERWARGAAVVFLLLGVLLLVQPSRINTFT